MSKAEVREAVQGMALDAIRSGLRILTWEPDPVLTIEEADR